MSLKQLEDEDLYSEEEEEKLCECLIC